MNTRQIILQSKTRRDTTLQDFKMNTTLEEIQTGSLIKGRTTR
jgi:hypothetical protein